MMIDLHPMRFAIWSLLLSLGCGAILNVQAQEQQADSMDPGKDLEQFNKAKNDRNAQKRLDALKKLAKYTNDRRVLETLVKTVKDGKDDQMKTEAAKMVAGCTAFRDPLLTRTLTEALNKTGNNTLQIAICQSLAKIGNERCAPSLRKLFSHGNHKVAQAAIEAAGQVRHDSFIRPLVNMLVKFDALDPMAKGDWPDKKRDLEGAVKTALANICGQTLATGKEYAAWADKKHEEAVKEQLDSLSKDLRSAKSDNDRASVIFNLAQSPLRDKKLLDTVSRYLSSGSELMRGEAITYVALYTDDKDAARSLLNALSANIKSEKLVEKILSAIAKMPVDPWAESKLINFAMSDDARVSGLAVRALAEQGTARSVEVMLRIYARLDKEKKADLRDDAKKRLDEKVKHLEPALKDSLGRMAGENKETFEDYLRWWTENRRGYKSPAQREQEKLEEEARLERERAKEAETKAKAEAAKPKPPPAPVGDGTGLAGHYYQGNNFRNLRIARIDETVDFDWGSNSGPGSPLDNDNFCVRWTGKLLPQHSETYTFHLFTDDGCRLWVNGKKIAEDWRDKAAEELTGTIDLTAGEKVDIKLEYYEKNGDATAKLLWSSKSTPRMIIPRTQLFPAALQKVKAANVAAKPDAPAPASGGNKPQPAPKPKPVEPPKPVDVAENGGFESGDLSGWTIFGGNILTINAAPQEGAFAVQMTGANGMYLSQPIGPRIKPGASYTVTAWIKIVPGEGRIGIDRLRISKTADLATSDFGQAKADPEKVNAWQKLEIKHTFSETDLAGPVFVGFRHFGFPGTVHVDTISVVADSP